MDKDAQTPALGLNHVKDQISSWAGCVITHCCHIRSKIGILIPSVRERKSSWKRRVERSGKNLGETGSIVLLQHWFGFFDQVVSTMYVNIEDVYIRAVLVICTN